MQNFRVTAERELMFLLHRKKIGFEEKDNSSRYSYPAEVLNFIRPQAPGNVKGEIREVID